MKKHVLNELKSAGMSGQDAERAFDEVSRAIGAVVERGERVRLPGVGTLVRTVRAETKRRSIATGEPITIAAREVVTLKKPRRF